MLSNAATLLEEEDYRQLLASIRPEILQTLREKQAYWQARYNPWVGRVQELMYEYYLKGNQIPSGQKNYAEVIAMILPCPAAGGNKRRENLKIRPSVGEKLIFQFSRGKDDLFYCQTVDYRNYCFLHSGNEMKDTLKSHQISNFRMPFASCVKNP